MDAQINQVGFKVAEWCKATKVSRSKVYYLPIELQPKSVKIGGSRIIIESPAAYLERMATAQQAQPA